MQLHVTGEHYVDVRLWDAATNLLQRGCDEQRGSFYQFLGATLFAFLAFEAFVNEVGRNLQPDVWKSEREFFGPRGKYRGSLGKFTFLARHCDHNFHSSKRPYQTVVKLAAVRDSLAHAKTEILDEVVSADVEMWDVPAQIDKWGSRKFAMQAVYDVERLADGLMAAAKKKHGEYAAGYRSSAFFGVRQVRSGRILPPHYE